MTPNKNVRPILAATALALALAACGGSPTKESTGELMDDSVITTKVKTALIADKKVSGTSVSVETFKGRVLLSGFVKSEAERTQAETTTRNVAGVKEVQNKIEVR
jgi:osmotically-inducible protein OsmY